MINQTYCLVDAEGWNNMGMFENLPLEVRERLRNSPYNLCVSCLWEKTYLLAGRKQPSVFNYLSVIDNMENEIRKQERDCLLAEQARIGIESNLNRS